MNPTQAFDAFLRTYAVAVSRGFDKGAGFEDGYLYISKARSAVERFWFWLDSDRTPPISIVHDDAVWHALNEASLEYERLDADLIKIDPCGLDLALTGDCEHTRIPKRKTRARSKVAA